jgi:hypothetical protein
MRPLLFLALGSLVACTASSPARSGVAKDPTPAQESAAPAGTTVTLQVPLTLATGEDAPHFKYFIGKDELQPNVAFDVLPAMVGLDGATRIRIEYRKSGGPADLTLEYPFLLVPGDDNTIPIAAMSTHNEVPPFGDIRVNFRNGTQTRSRLEGTIDGDLSLQIKSGPRVSWVDSAESGPGSLLDLPMLPTFVGQYRWAWANTSFDYLIDPSVIPNPLFGDGGRTSMGYLTFAADPKAQFPLAVAQKWNVVCNGFEGDPNWGAAADWGVAANQTISFDQDGQLTCRAGSGNARAGVVIDPGWPVKMQLTRIDVADIELPSHPGTTVPGTYSIVTEDGHVVVTDAPTQTGVDLPPGKYALTMMSPQVENPIVKVLDL